MSLRRATYATARRVVVAVVGGTLLLIGAILLFVPGPGTVVIGVGLAVLAGEFAWARRWLRRAREAGLEVARRAGVARDDGPRCEQRAEEAKS